MIGMNLSMLLSCLDAEAGQTRCYPVSLCWIRRFYLESSIKQDRVMIFEKLLEFLNWEEEKDNEFPQEDE